jgi:FKBP-type peptidyl-prolyl isomerase-like protein
MLRLFLAVSLAAVVIACRSEGKPSTLDALRAAVDPPPPPPDTIPEVLDYAADLQVDLSEMAKLPVGVLYAELAPGEGLQVVAGDSVEVAFQGWLPNGAKVDSAVTALRVGAGDVIAGIDAALPGMKPGGRRKLVLTPGLAFGAEGRDNIPPNSVLVYDVELRAKLP